MSCQQVPTTPAFNPYPRSVQVGEFEVAIGGGIWVAIRVQDESQRRYLFVAIDRATRWVFVQFKAKGSLLAARRWLDAPNQALDGLTPEDAAKTPEGFARVYQLLRGNQTDED